MLDSMYHMTLILLKITFFGMKKSRFPCILHNIKMDITVNQFMDFIAWGYITLRRRVINLLISQLKYVVGTQKCTKWEVHMFNI